MGQAVGRARRASAAVWLSLAVAAAAYAETAAPQGWQALSAQVADLYNQRRYAEAIPLAEQALADAEQQLGEDHPAVASCLNNLASLYVSQQAYDKAEPLYARSLSIKQRLLGPSHPTIATSLNNLASLYAVQKRYTDAQMLYRNAITLLSQTLDADHPFMVGITKNLNKVVQMEKEAAKPEPTPPLFDEMESAEEPAGGESEADPETQAVALLQWKLQAMEETLGPSHPHVAELLTAIAVQFDREGRHTESEPLYRRALAIAEQSRGPNHASVASAAANLGRVYEALGRDAEAEANYLRALDIDQRSSQNDRATFADFSRLEHLYTDRKRWDDAAALYAKWLKLLEDLYGPKDPEVASVLERYADTLDQQGKSRKARELRTRAERIRSR